MEKIKNLFIIFMVILFSNLIFSIQGNSVELNDESNKFNENFLDYILFYEQILLFAEKYEESIKRGIEEAERFEHKDESENMNTGFSMLADALLIATAGGNTEHVNATILVYPKASVVVEYLPKIKKTSTNEVHIICYWYDGSDELEELHYGNRSYFKAREELEKLVEKGELKKIEDEKLEGNVMYFLTYENADGVKINVEGFRNIYQPVKGMPAHLPLNVEEIEFLFEEYMETNLILY